MHSKAMPVYFMLRICGQGSIKLLGLHTDNSTDATNGEEDMSLHGYQ